MVHQYHKKNNELCILRELMLHANTLTGADAYCFKAFAEALEIIPYTLAENAGLNPIGERSNLLTFFNSLHGF